MAKCTNCGSEVTCYYNDVGGSAEYRDLYFYVCVNCGHKESEEIYAGQTASDDEITQCPYCGVSCLDHIATTNDAWTKFREETPEAEQEKPKPIQ